MFKKKKIDLTNSEIDLTNLEKFLKTIGKFNESQIENTKRIEEILEKMHSASFKIDNFGRTTDAILNTISYVEDIDIGTNSFEKFGSVTFDYEGKEYSLVPNCRNKTVINKDGAVLIMQIAINGIQEMKYTTIENLSEEEKTEYNKTGFIIEKIVNKEEKNV